MKILETISVKDFIKGNTVYILFTPDDSIIEAKVIKKFNSTITMDNQMTFVPGIEFDIPVLRGEVLTKYIAFPSKEHLNMYKLKIRNIHKAKEKLKELYGGRIFYLSDKSLIALINVLNELVYKEDE